MSTKNMKNKHIDYSWYERIEGGRLRQAFVFQQKLLYLWPDTKTKSL